MNWEAITAIAEVAGLIAVATSLVYIGIQTRQSNAHAEASAETAWFDSLNQITCGWVSDDRTISAIQRGFRNFNDLSKSDQAIFHMQIGALVNHWMLSERLSAKRLVKKEFRDTFTKVVVSLLATPGGLQYWEHDARTAPWGKELLERARESIGNQPTFTDIFPWWVADESD